MDCDHIMEVNIACQSKLLVLNIVTDLERPPEDGFIQTQEELIHSRVLLLSVYVLEDGQ